MEGVLREVGHGLEEGTRAQDFLTGGIRRILDDQRFTASRR